ncbi:MAG TPA: aminotransferase class III-fold pyridoxal phosphate-dependent enzyme [Syntrophomonadaceae bacterium]|nr:aminotransferase class III-fold pyridoxal phosphate-dependent enzyme [Syntrophomonadaceae bacterium]
MSVLEKDLLNPTLAEVLTAFRLDKMYTRGKGSLLYDEEGTAYLDFISQYGAIPFGYNPENIWEALEAVRSSALPSLVQPSMPVEALRLAGKLAEITPGDLRYCTFCQSGTEAVEAAIKLVRSAAGKEIIISAQNSFHGKTLGALSATGKSSYQRPFRAPAPGFLKVPFNDLPALERVMEQHRGQVAAFIVEPVQGEGGIIPAQPGYLAAAGEICRRYEAFLIVDEIQTGLGRTGRMFACQHEGVEPDVLLLAKALGGGLVPMGACISSPRVWNEDFGHLHSSTFANNNLTCAVGVAVLERLLANNQELVRQVADKGDYLIKRLHSLARRFPQVIKEVRGLGLMLGVEFYGLQNAGSYNMSFICEAGGFTGLLAGFLLNVYNIRLAPFLNESMTLRLEPTLTITYEEIDYLLQALEDLCTILEHQDYAKLYRFLLDDCSRPDQIRDYRPFFRGIKPSTLREGEQISNRFAFILHYPGPEDMVCGNPSFEQFSREELYRLMEWQASLPEPSVCCHMPAIRSRQGHVIEGWLIGVPYGGREIMNKPRHEVLRSLTQAVDIARELGAQVVGLGALTSVVSRGGRDLQNKGVAITSGNSLTVVIALEALYKGAIEMKIDIQKARAAVVGATGSIGRACALLLSEEACNIVLLGNSKARLTSQRRLKGLAGDILTRANRKRKDGVNKGMCCWLSQVIAGMEKLKSPWTLPVLDQLQSSEEIGWDIMEEICRGLNIEPPLVVATDIDRVLLDCDLVVAASNSSDYLIYPRHLKTGAVVCDVARPADVSPEVIAQRDDVLILEGGLVQLPEPVSFGPNLGYDDGVTLACLSETILLAMEGDQRDHSIGAHLPMETLDYMRTLAAKHGFCLSGLKMGSQEIDSQEIANICERAACRVGKEERPWPNQKAVP